MGTTLLNGNLAEKVYNKSKTLNKEQVSQVLDFIEFLISREKKGVKKNPFIEFIASDADPEMTLDAVRQQLKGIKGNLADAIIKDREERV